MPRKNESQLKAPEKEIRSRTPVGKIRRNIDYGIEFHRRLEEASDELNISSQALVKLAVQEWLDRYTIAKHYSLPTKTAHG